MAATFNASAQVLSIGVFFTLMILGLAAALPQHPVPRPRRPRRPAADAPCGCRTFRRWGACSRRSWATTRWRRCSVRTRSPNSPPPRPTTSPARPSSRSLIAGPFGEGLSKAFSFAAVICVLGGVASLLRGGKYHYVDTETVLAPDGAPVAAGELVGAGVRASGDADVVSPEEAVAETEPLLVD